MYEPPYGSGALEGNGPDDYEPKLKRLLREGKRGEAVDLFLSIVGAPPEAIEGMHRSPAWPAMEAVAPTLAYDAACVNGGLIPIDLAAAIRVPTLAMNGGAGFAYMRSTAQQLARIIPNARYLELPDQTHNVDVSVLAPVLAEFFCADVLVK
jgi:pimeloyl-ACP methyl ester carboxylesterase